MMNSYNEYKEIIREIKKTGKYMDYIDVKNNTEMFIILRHDVDFDIKRAYNFAQLEKDLDFTSSYFFQIHSDFYNVLSRKNTLIIKNIIDMGHRIGLHFSCEPFISNEELRKDIVKQITVLSETVGINIDRFSFHRPPHTLLENNIEIEGLLNVYSDQYFNFVKSAEELADVKIKYISDSRYKWRYGYPSKETLNNYPKIHILIHPCSWSEKGSDLLNHFKLLINEKQNELYNDFENSCDHFNYIKHLLK